MLAVLEFQDFAIIAMLVAIFGGGVSYASFRPTSGPRLRRLELKVNAIIQHMGIELPDDLAQDRLSTSARRLADDGKKLEAIRAQKEEKGMGLKQAKEAVEDYLAQ